MSIRNIATIACVWLRYRPQKCRSVPFVTDGLLIFSIGKYDMSIRNTVVAPRGGGATAPLSGSSSPPPRRGKLIDSSGKTEKKFEGIPKSMILSPCSFSRVLLR